MKKLFRLGLMAMVFCVILAGCGKKDEKKNENIDLTLSEIVAKLYEGIDKDELPKLAEIDINKDNMAYYIGVSDLDIKEGIASEPAFGSIAHSIVVIRVNDGVDVEKAKKDIEKNVDPRKWICVDAENVFVESKGDVIVLIMMDEEQTDLAEQIRDNFKKL